MAALPTVLVTGGNGFIGQHLVRRLVRGGYRVSLLQRSPDKVDSRAELLRTDSLSSGEIAAVLAGRRFDWVFHLAGYGVRPGDRNAETMFSVNVDLTWALVEMASHWSPRAIVIAGSGSEYRLDTADRPVTEDQTLESSRLYGTSKAAGTLCSAALASARCVPFAACRIFGVYGPGEAPHRLLPSLIDGMRGSGRIPLSLGLQKRDFLFVDDVVDALLQVAGALESESRQFIVNVGTGQPLSVREFVHIAATILGIPEHRLGFGEIPMRDDDVKMFSGNPAKLHALTGWQAKIDPSEGIRRSLNPQVSLM